MPACAPISRAALGALVVLLAAAPAHAQRCRSVGSVDRPVPYEQVQEIPGTGGPFRFRKAVSKQCRSGLIVSDHRGLLDESGRRVLVPARYLDVVPISETTALVMEAGPRWSYYDYGRGVRGDAPYRAAQLYGGSERDPVSGYWRGELAGRVWRVEVEPQPTPVAWRPPGPREAFPTLHIFAGGAAPMEIPQMERIDLMDSLAVVHFHGEGHGTLSRIFTRTLGEPRSPVLGLIERWREVPRPASGAAAGPPVLVTQSLLVQGHPLFHVGRLRLPIAADGTPQPLPAGIVGVIPIQQDRMDLTEGWVLVFADPDGLTVAPVHATLADALAGAATSRRWSGADLLSQHGTWNPRPWSALRDADTGQWQLFDRSIRPMQDPIGRAMAGHRFASAVEAGEAYTGAVEGQRLASEAVLLARQVTAREAALTQDLARIQAQGICATASPELHAADVLERYFRDCLVSDRLRQALGSRVSAEARAAAYERAMEAWRAHNAQVQREREAILNASPQVQQGTPSAANAWARGLDAAQQRVNSSYNDFLQRQHTVYMTNLRAWNSGAQNWCCQN